MNVLTRFDEVQQSSIPGGVLIPTMGALHAGHLSLVASALSHERPVTATIFVNPTQFGPHEDLSKYPRRLEADLELLRQAGVTNVFVPSSKDMYPRPASTLIQVPEVTEWYEGVVRPHHFAGVATVVCKLFQVCRPATALFGLKDLQQCAVIKRMVEDLNMPVRLCFEPTIRDKSGLAMSSRNAYLSPAERDTAAELYRHLDRSTCLLRTGKEVESVLGEAKGGLEKSGFVVDYFDLTDAETFQPSTRLTDLSAVVAAVRIGSTRLIDNLWVYPERANL